MKMAMKDGKIMLIEVDNTQMAIIKSWNSMKYDRRRNMMIGDCSKELLDKLSKIVRLPPAIESYRQRLDETQRAVDKMRVEKEPEALVKYPVQGSLYEHQVRAANMALLTFGLADPKEVLKMKDASMSLGIYFEIKDAELYGGEGTTGYAATIVEISIEGLQNADFEKYANSQLEAMASMAKVPKEKVRIISKDEYEENTEEE